MVRCGAQPQPQPRRRQRAQAAAPSTAAAAARRGLRCPARVTLIATSGTTRAQGGCPAAMRPMSARWGRRLCAARRMTGNAATQSRSSTSAGLVRPIRSAVCPPSLRAVQCARAPAGGTAPGALGGRAGAESATANTTERADRHRPRRRQLRRCGHDAARPDDIRLDQRVLGSSLRPRATHPPPGHHGHGHSPADRNLRAVAPSHPRAQSGRDPGPNRTGERGSSRCRRDIRRLRRHQRSRIPGCFLFLNNNE